MSLCFSDAYTAFTVADIISAGRVNDRIPTVWDYKDKEWAGPDEEIAVPFEIGLSREEGKATYTFAKTYKTLTAWDVSLPPLSAQWRDDMSRRVRVARRRDPNAYPVLKAPQSFIDTGIWPDDVPRPGVGG